jgi:DNA-binding MarR family transcriptional regulator
LALVTLPDLETTPGHLIRRAAQVHKALWSAHVPATLTSPQYAVLVALAREDNLDQRMLGERVSLDRSTTADVVLRLTRRELVARVRDPSDGRRNVLTITDLGRTAMKQSEPSVLEVRRLLLEPLSPAESEQLTSLLRRVVTHFDQAAT